MVRLKTYFSYIVTILCKYKYLLALLIGLGVIALVAPIIYTYTSTRGHRYDLARTSVNNVPFHHVTIVFGAGIYANGTPTPYLQHRIETAVKLYRAHRTDILLMTGDNSVAKHDEPRAMRNYARKLGVPAKAIVIDDAGFDTYDSCYRAHAIFGVRSATLVSQGYHLPRAMVTCQHLGVANSGVIAIHPTRDYTISYLVREIFSTDKMVFQLMFKPHPMLLGKPLPIH